MTNELLLREKIKESGYKIYYVAERAGLTYQGFLNKLSNEREFVASEIQALTDLLHLSLEEQQQIFFACNVEKSST